MLDPVDVELVKRCLQSYYDGCPKMLPVVPEEMRQEADDSAETWDDDWIGWKLVPSRLTEEDVLAIERELPFRLPPLFRAFLVTYFVLDMDFGDFLLPTLPSDNPLAEVEQYLFQENLWRIGYAPFASGSSGDPVCFDLEAPGDDGDYPVVIINHDAIASQADWEHRERVERAATRESDTFREFFTRLCLGDSKIQRLSDLPGDQGSANVGRL